MAKRRNILEVSEELAARLTRDRRTNRPLLVGIAGAPGAGKSTLGPALASAIAAELQGACICVSLDDFYYSPGERETRGYSWRAQPGTHDMRLLAQFLRALDVDRWLDIPRYDTSLDRRGHAERVQGPLAGCVLEGWFVGMQDHSYDVLAQRIDKLVFIDISERNARLGRFARERRMRISSSGGLSEEKMEIFWNDVLRPGIERWVNPLRELAHVVLPVDGAHTTEGPIWRS